jgi:drug/metabolite transporter (DMT)-like permease
MSYLWALITIAAAGSQTARNTLQRTLVAKVGAVGATHVRFMFGLPFALLFLGILALWLHVSDANFGLLQTLGSHNERFWIALIGGSIFQIFATLYMLLAMERQSFVVVTAFVKTEPLLVALFGVLFIGDSLSTAAWFAVAIASLGVLIFSWPQKSATRSLRTSDFSAAIVPGLVSASCFAFSVLGFRSAVMALDLQSAFYVRALLVLALGQLLQTVALSLWLRLKEPGRLTQLFNAWKPSLIAGFFGASASGAWYMAFALETAAKVRTLGLIEIFFALIVSKQLLKQKISATQIAGLVMLAVGMSLLFS